MKASAMVTTTVVRKLREAQMVSKMAMLVTPSLSSV